MNKTQTLPVLGIRKRVLLPGLHFRIHVGRPRSLKLVESICDPDTSLLVEGTLVLICAVHDEEDSPEKKNENNNNFSVDDLESENNLFRCDDGDVIFRHGTIARVVSLSSSRKGSSRRRLLTAAGGGRSSGTVSMVVEGVSRGYMKTIVNENPFLTGRVATISDVGNPDDTMVRALALNIRRSLAELVLLGSKRGGGGGRGDDRMDQLKESLDTIERSKPGLLADLLIGNLSLPVLVKQRVLQANELENRLQLTLDMLNKQAEVMKVSEEIESRVNGNMKDMQREYALKQRLDAINEELIAIRERRRRQKKEKQEQQRGQQDDSLRSARGRQSEEDEEEEEEEEEEDDEPQSVVEKLEMQLEKAGLPDEVRAVAMRELERFRSIPSTSAEHSVTRTYLECLADFPWQLSTTDNLDVEHAQRQLDEDHHGLDKVKQRLVEFVAVQSLRPSSNAPIMCLVGPPGVGKTSLGRSVADSLGRKFIRIALGGVRDEADIRGHRRTYVGALPGKLVQAMRRVQTNNPVILLDEVDKLGRGQQGDPGAALLEVLDPEQNNTFTDHYMDVPIDLSRVLFIATANSLETIPAPLLDRMEVIQVAGYTSREKTEIAIRHLVPKQLGRHGMDATQLSVTSRAWDAVLQKYTREAGVRGLDREISAVCRHAAVRIVKGETQSITVDEQDLEGILGPARYESEVAQRTAVPGVATGLAWTQAGGEILFVEASVHRSGGKRSGGGMSLQLTGQLGKVMEESVRAALSFVRANLAQVLAAGTNQLVEDQDQRVGGIETSEKRSGFGIDQSDLKEPLVSRRMYLGLSIEEWEDHVDSLSLHVHFPAGAVPKDGPSAGVAVVAAITSAITGRRIRKDTACTGEITLRGLVLPVGGVKEKVLAAHRAGIRRVVLPSRNSKDTKELPDEVVRDMEFVYAGDIVTALDALVGDAEVSLMPFAAPARGFGQASL